jgi:hypothetical protein
MNPYMSIYRVKGIGVLGGALSYKEAQNESTVKLASDLTALTMSLTALAMSLWAVWKVAKLAPVAPPRERFLQTLNRLKRNQKALDEFIDDYDRTGDLYLVSAINRQLDTMGWLYSELSDYAYMLDVKPEHRHLVVSFADACDDMTTLIARARFVFDLSLVKKIGIEELAKYSPRLPIIELATDEGAKLHFDTLVKVKNKVEAATKRKIALRSADYRSFTVIDLARDIAEISRALIEFAQSEIEPLIHA